MPYISNPLYIGFGVVDSADASALVRNAKFRDTYTKIFQALKNTPPATVRAIAAKLKQTLDQMPLPEQEMHVRNALNAAKTIDPRTAPGLGEPSAALANLAAIAGTLTSLTTLTLGVVQFVDQRKKTKEQKAAQDKEQALINQQTQMEIDARKQQIAAQQQQAQLDAQGLKLDAQGNPIAKTSSGATLAAVVAAGAGAFLLTK